MKRYKTYVGLELHIQLDTKSKMFAPEACVYGGTPNTYTSTITLAHPGTLPSTPNRNAIEKAIRLGIAVQGKITSYNFFDRKHYYYPDLPKGYQITQYRTPLVSGGEVTYEHKGKSLTFPLIQIHLEEDTGKMNHDWMNTHSLIDYNRAGWPLAELVTDKVEMGTGEEIISFLRTLRCWLRYLKVSRANMEEGSLRCDCNISVTPVQQKKFNSKIEIKNLNSFQEVLHALRYEKKRQIELLEKNVNWSEETRTFCTVQKKTLCIRKKEQKSDYRYLPEQDLRPFHVDKNWLKNIKKEMPLLPHIWEKKWIEEYGLSKKQARWLVEKDYINNFFINFCKHTTYNQQAFNSLKGPILSFLRKEQISIQEFPLPFSIIAKLINYIEKGQIAFSVAYQDIFPRLIEGEELDEVMKKGGFLEKRDGKELEEIVIQTLQKYSVEVERYKKGELKLWNFFIGKIMSLKQKFHPKEIKKILKEKLENK